MGKTPLNRIFCRCKFQNIMLIYMSFCRFVFLSLSYGQLVLVSVHSLFQEHWISAWRARHSLSTCQRIPQHRKGKSEVYEIDGKIMSKIILETIFIASNFYWLSFCCKYFKQWEMSLLCFLDNIHPLKEFCDLNWFGLTSATEFG